MTLAPELQAQADALGKSIAESMIDHMNDDALLIAGLHPTQCPTIAPVQHARDHIKTRIIPDGPDDYSGMRLAGEAEAEKRDRKLLAIIQQAASHPWRPPHRIVPTLSGLARDISQVEYIELISTQLQAANARWWQRTLDKVAQDFFNQEKP